MAANIKNSASGGHRKSSAAKSVAGAVANTSSRAKRGTSDTTTAIGQSIEAPNTGEKTAPRRRTKRNASAGTPDSGSESVALPAHTSTHVVSRFKIGPLIERVLVVMDPETAAQLIDISAAREAVVVSGVYRDLEVIASRDPALATSALAGAAVSLALEMENPYNSATSKSMCANALLATTNQLRALLPPEQETSEIDELRARREARTVTG